MVDFRNFNYDNARMNSLYVDKSLFFKFKINMLFSFKGVQKKKHDKIR